MMGLDMAAEVVSRGRVLRRLRPDWEATGLAALAALGTLVTLIALLTSAAGFAAGIPLIARLFSWCTHAAGEVPWWVGISSLIALSATVPRAMAVTARYLWARPHKGAPGVVVVDTPAVFAHSLGGRNGQVITSRGLIEQTNPAERRVIFAHEAAHLRMHHHRLLLVAQVAALNPLLRPLSTRLRFALERAADEEAVRCVGDRDLVARTVSRVALLSSAYSVPQGLRVDGSSVIGRVEALLVPGTVAPPRMAVATALGVMAMAGALTCWQWPHIAELALHLCTF